MMTLFSGRRGKAVVKGGLVALTLLLVAPLGTVSADARASGGFSFGSRGARTFSMPSATQTAPRPAQPFQRTETQNPGNFGMNAGAQPRRFGGFGTGVAARLLGAGLFGLLTGNGFFGGLSGLSSLFGLLFQILLIVGLIALVMRFFRGRQGGPVFAGGPILSPRMAARPLGGGTGAQGSVTIGPQDYAAFEQTLVAIQSAFSREDQGALARLTTPEVQRYFGADLAGNRNRGVRNDIQDVRLLQGDLAESWREGTTDYATVAMRFDARDVMVDRASGRIVAGNPNTRSEATELWTFRRDNGGPWILAGVQQVN
jgi:predicted lipid-binding transport protein (Tim44 family)